MLACLMTRPLPPGLARLLGATRRRPPLTRGASATEPQMRNAGSAYTGALGELQCPEEAARGRQEPGLRRYHPLEESCVPEVQRRQAAPKGRRKRDLLAGEPLQLGPASRGSASSSSSPPSVLGVPIRRTTTRGGVLGPEGGWLPRLPCPEEEPAAREPSRGPLIPKELSKMRLWPNPEHAGGRHRTRERHSRRVKIPAFSTTAAVAAASLALCYTKGHVSKGDEQTRLGTLRLHPQAPAVKEGSWVDDGDGEASAASLRRWCCWSDSVEGGFMRARSVGLAY